MISLLEMCATVVRVKPEAEISTTKSYLCDGKQMSR